jgi:hypothetical protein
MKLNITIDSDNVGMETVAQAAEVLRNLANKIEDIGEAVEPFEDIGLDLSANLLDQNGNKIGQWSLTRSE